MYFHVTYKWWAQINDLAKMYLSRSFSSICVWRCHDMNSKKWFLAKCAVHVSRHKKSVEIVLSLLVQWWALPFTDGVNNWNPSHCGWPERRLLLVDKAQLTGYLLKLLSNPLVCDAGIQCQCAWCHWKHCHRSECEHYYTRPVHRTQMWSIWGIGLPFAVFLRQHLILSP